MTSTRKTTWILAATVFGVAVIAAVWYATSPVPSSTTAASAAPSGPVNAVRPAVKDETPTLPEHADAAKPTVTAPALIDTTVVWPVKVELELVRGTQMPTAKDTPAFHTGATARFSGRILRGELGIPATVTFIAGPNVGRSMSCNEKGEFGALDLYPGVGEVRVTGPGIESVREVRLPATGTPEQLNISYDLPGEVWGGVLDAEQKPLAGVDVELDGHHTETDETGTFHFETMTAGDALELILKKAGYATYWQRMGVPAGREIPKGQNTFTLQPAASIEIALAGRPGASKGDAQVILLPEQLNLKRAYPWHRVSPLAVPPGVSRRIDDLPSTRIRVRVFLDGAIAEPEQSTVTTRAGEVAHLDIKLDPAPALNGIVRDREGRAVENARVVSETPDRMATTQQYLSEGSEVFENEIIPPLAPAVGETRTNFRGEFLLSQWPRFGDARYVTASTDDGKLFGSALAKAGQKQVDIVVAPITQGAAELALDFTGRHQGLPVEVRINGVPLEPRTVPAQEALKIPDLATGTWRMRVSWNGRSILPQAYVDFDLMADLSKSIDTPLGAVQGQDADTRLRAGKQPASYVPSDFAPPKK